MQYRLLFTFAIVIAALIQDVHIYWKLLMIAPFLYVLAIVKNIEDKNPKDNALTQKEKSLLLPAFFIAPLTILLAWGCFLKPLPQKARGVAWLGKIVLGIWILGVIGIVVLASI